MSLKRSTSLGKTGKLSELDIDPEGTASSAQQQQQQPQPNDVEVPSQVVQPVFPRASASLQDERIGTIRAAIGNRSSNSLSSDMAEGFQGDAFIGDYDMKRSPSTQAFMFEQLQYRENKLRSRRLQRPSGLPLNVPLTALLDFRNGGDSFCIDEEGNPLSETSLAADVLSSTIDVYMEGVDSLIDDNFWKCFEPHKPEAWNWNLYLMPMYHLGILVRYLLLFPIRLVIFLLGWLIFGILMTIVQVFLPKGPSRKAFEHSLISFQCGVFTLTWGAVIRFHGSPPYSPKNGTNCVFVANHTSMIDVIVLQQSRCFSLVGQQHKGWVKFLQEVVLGCLQCIWFDRGEMKDREIVSRRLTEHAKDPTRNPLLVFPEGTCVNNEYCIQFKKGVFELGVPIAPVAIKYNKMFVDPFWNSREQSFLMHLVELMTSWCLICDVYYLEPQTIKPGETAVKFAARVKSMIAKTAGLHDVDWDGYMKYWKPSKRYVDNMQKKNADTLRNIQSIHRQLQQEQDGNTSPYAPNWAALPTGMKHRHPLPSTKEE